MTTFWVEMTECNQHFTTFKVWKNKDPRWVEFRSDGMNQWRTPEQANCGEVPGQKLHDGMLGWHTSVLHAGDSCAVLPHHEDFEFVRSMFENA